MYIFFFFIYLCRVQFTFALKKKERKNDFNVIVQRSNIFKRKNALV